MAYSKPMVARIAGKVAAKFPKIAVTTLDAITDEVLLERERMDAIRGDSVDDVAAASGTAPATPKPDAQRERERQKARQDDALDSIRTQWQGGSK